MTAPRPIRADECTIRNTPDDLVPAYVAYRPGRVAIVSHPSGNYHHENVRLTIARLQRRGFRVTALCLPTIFRRTA